MMKRFYICTKKECIRRRIDSQNLFNYFTKNNWKFTNIISNADLIIITTCGALKEDEDLSVNTIKMILKEKRDSAQLIVAGCLPKINHEKIKELGDFISIPPRNMEAFDQIIGATIKFRDISDSNIFSNIPDLIPELNSLWKKFKMKFSFNPDFFQFLINWFIGRVRVYKGKVRDKFSIVNKSYNIRIAVGCVGNCSYCAIKFSVKNLKSKSLEVIMEEFKSGLKQGYKVFMLVAEDAGSYGIDIGLSFVDLLKSLFDYKDEFTLLFSDLNPQWLIKYQDELLPLLEKNSFRLKFLNIPIQSASNRILGLMKRPYKIQNVTAIIRKLKDKLPKIKLHTAIIVGFPGETEEDFNKSRDVLCEFKFSKVGVYKYSDRPNTVSSKLNDKIQGDLLERRYLEMNRACGNI